MKGKVYVNLYNGDLMYFSLLGNKHVYYLMMQDKQRVFKTEVIFDQRNKT